MCVDYVTFVEHSRCHMCSVKLIPHPLYEPSGAMYCPDHGDYFIQRLRGELPKIIFTAFERKVYREVSTTTNAQLFVIRKKPTMAPSELTPDPYPERRVRGKPQRHGRAVRCDQTGIIYRSVSFAADMLGVHINQISQHINGKTRHVHGHTFTPIDDIDNPPPFVPKPLVRRGGGRPAKKIQCEQTGQIFETIREACDAMQLNRQGVGDHLNNRLRRPNVQGYTFIVVT